MTVAATHPAPLRPSPRLRRILLYTHNSIGLGHVVRCLAVIDGIRRQRPDLDFLVITGSALPQLFLAERVEVLRLPGLRQDLEQSRPVLQPRFLTGLAVPELVRLRQRLIGAAAEEFAPQVVMVEHYPAGLHGEALPLLGLGPAALPRRAYALVHLGRGEPQQPAWPTAALPSLGDLLRAYDFLYVLNHPQAAAADGANEAIPRERLRHLGPVASRLRAELPPRGEVLARFGLGDRGLVLLSLGRGGPVLEMARCLLDALPLAGLSEQGAVLVLDPYLEPGAVTALQEMCRRAGALAVPFVPCLVEAVAAADLVVCRAGYNAIAELLMTGTRALVVPERHPSGEQERRCRDLPREHILVAEARELTSGQAAELLQRASRLPRGAGHDGYDRFAVGRRIVDDLEAWLAARERRNGP
jgi:predicted glycosyltransferase